MKFNKNNNVNTQNGNNVWSIEFATEVINSYAKEIDEDIMPIINESRKYCAENFGVKKEQMIEYYGKVTADILEACLYYLIAGFYANEVMNSMGKSQFYMELVSNLLRESYFEDLTKKYGRAKVAKIQFEFASGLKNDLNELINDIMSGSSM